ncbi:prepilin-type N-terminal cleavage/methylation domain-containing protein [Candidatus Poribacteria bacterium]|nr:prepilin-type N-terminal cleavage/methylation domain-containing protein [Candidatus Poribacteria bacterium]MBT5534636.1 prepilin-type N-terminal cleavage/methylation domain-containing protein [Candidatus Poribacteria bacterium]MBT5710755.1 prepilin-type N-terminal cleavage/methylation domain-containing protein [Candidatus Poribacteria bacterium]
MTAAEPRRRLRRRRPRSDRGFTLVEMLVVLAIMSILLTIGAPSLRAFSEGRKLNAAADSVRGLCLYARDAAMAEGEAFVVVFDFTEQSFWLAKEAALEFGDLSATVGLGALGPDAEEEAAETGVAVGGAAAGLTRGILGRPQDMVKAVVLARIDVDREGAVNTTTVDFDYITFRPDGTAEPASVYFVNTDNRGAVVDVPLAAARTKARRLSQDEMSFAGLSTEAL